MPTFDVVSEIDEAELKNAVANTTREVATRFDFHGVEATLSITLLTVTLKSESEFQVKQLETLFRQQCAKRKVDTNGVEMEKEPIHSGKFYSLNMTFKQGIDQASAKEIVKHIKDSKIKVQARIEGDKIRVSGKKRDDLQEIIALLKKAEISLPLQFNNFRD